MCRDQAPSTARHSERTIPTYSGAPGYDTVASFPAAASGDATSLTTTSDKIVVFRCVAA